MFDETIPSYVCAHCSPDCLVNKADDVAKKKGYDVYVVPGGSCVGKILKVSEVRGRRRSGVWRRNKDCRENS